MNSYVVAGESFTSSNMLFLLACPFSHLQNVQKTVKFDLVKQRAIPFCLADGVQIIKHDVCNVFRKSLLDGRVTPKVDSRAGVSIHPTERRGYSASKRDAALADKAECPF